MSLISYFNNKFQILPSSTTICAISMVEQTLHVAKELELEIL